MKKMTYLLGFVFVLFLAGHTQAQINIPKNLTAPAAAGTEAPDADLNKELLSALDPGKSFTSPDKYMKLLGKNKDLVGNVLGVMNGSGSEEDKLAKVGALNSEHKDFVEQLLGKGKAADYYKLIKGKLEPLYKKFALAKLFM